MDRLCKRRDFLAAAKARRAGVGCCLMQGRDRGDAGTVRVGFTVTKKIGNAVVRNRIRRRLREAVEHVLPKGTHPGHDYVLVARHQALSASFDDLVRDIARALRKLHDPGSGPARAGAHKPGGHKSGAPPASAFEGRSPAQRQHSRATPVSHVRDAHGGLDGCVPTGDTQLAIRNPPDLSASKTRPGAGQTDQNQTLETQMRICPAPSSPDGPGSARSESPSATDGGSPA
ncbi:ribonuclease P protein component [Xanthobacter sp. TB0136]|uniref:ribonuclease P protein component n=1 Tax=Xanthobacter sp. TB0136 TaxID=3459177 RepID=UPI004039B940